MVCAYPVNDWEAIDVTIEGIWFGSEEDFDVVRVADMIEELSWITKEVEEAMKSQE